MKPDLSTATLEVVYAAAASSVHVLLQEIRRSFKYTSVWALTARNVCHYGDFEFSQPLRPLSPVFSLPINNQLRAYDILRTLEAQRSSTKEIGVKELENPSTCKQHAFPSVEDRLSSLSDYVKLEASSRASMSALYNNEFLRVGNDMLVTKEKHDELSAKVEKLGAMSTHVNADRDVVVDVKNAELQGMLEAAVEQKVGGLKTMIDAAVKEQLGGLQAELVKEQDSREKLTDMVRVKLNDFSDTLHVRNAGLGQSTGDGHDDRGAT